MKYRIGYNYTLSLSYMVGKQYFVLFLFIVMALMSGCRHKPDSRLTDIDSIIESNPDSAYIALKAIKRETISDDDMPYYALLFTQAQIKCNENVTSDSLIGIAYDYYCLQDDSELKKRAYFYNAQIAYNAGRYQTAMVDALAAYEMSKDENDSYWIAKSAEMISDIMFDTFNIEESLPYEYEAASQYEKAGKILNHRYVLCDLATTYIHLKRYREALSLLDSLKSVITNEHPLDSDLLEYLNRTVPSALYFNGEFERLEHFLSETEMPEKTIDKITLSFDKANFLNNKQLLDSASKIIAFAGSIAQDDRQKVVMLYSAFNNAFRREDYKKAALLADSLIVMQNSLVSHVMKESASEAERDFYFSKSEILKKETTFKSRLILSIAVGSAIVVFLLIIIYRIKLRARIEELEKNTLQIISLREEALRKSDENKILVDRLAKNEKNTDKLKNQLLSISEIETQKNEIIESLFREKWSTLNMLCNQYFEIYDKDITRVSVLNNIDKEIKKLRSSRSLREIEESVNKYLGNIMSLVREECPDLKDEDYNFMTLIYGGSRKLPWQGYPKMTLTRLQFERE